MSDVSKIAFQLSKKILTGFEPKFMPSSSAWTFIFSFGKSLLYHSSFGITCHLEIRLDANWILSDAIFELPILGQFINAILTFWYPYQCSTCHFYSLWGKVQSQDDLKYVISNSKNYIDSWSLKVSFFPPTIIYQLNFFFAFANK